jgi:hypothetical protein
MPYHYHERPQDVLAILRGILVVAALIVAMVLFFGWANGLKP